MGDPGVGKTSFIQRFTNNSWSEKSGADSTPASMELPGGRRVVLTLVEVPPGERSSWMARVNYRKVGGGALQRMKETVRII